MHVVRSSGVRRHRVLREAQQGVESAAPGPARSAADLGGHIMRLDRRLKRRQHGRSASHVPFHARLPEQASKQRTKKHPKQAHREGHRRPRYTVYSNVVDIQRNRGRYKKTQTHKSMNTKYMRFRNLIRTYMEAFQFSSHCVSIKNAGMSGDGRAKRVRCGMSTLSTRYSVT